MVKKWLLSLVGLIVLSVAGHAEDFLIVGDDRQWIDGFEDRIFRVSLSTGNKQRLGGTNVGFHPDIFHVHQYNRQLYTVLRGQKGWHSISLETLGTPEVVAPQPGTVAGVAINPDENIFYSIVSHHIVERTFTGDIRAFHPFPSLHGSGYGIDFDLGTNYIAAVFEDMKTITGGVIGGEVHQLLFTPGFELDDIAIDANTGIVYAVNNTGGVYSVNQDGSDPTFLGSAGLDSQPAPAKYFLDVYNDVIYLGYSSGLYAVPKDQFGMPLDQFAVCDNCIENVARVLYVVDDFVKSGDTDLDYDIDLADYNTLSSNFDPTGTLDKVWRHGDFNGDHIVDLSDYNLLSGNFSPMPYDRHLDTAASEMAVPEPSAAVIALLGMLLISVFGRLSVLK